MKKDTGIFASRLFIRMYVFFVFVCLFVFFSFHSDRYLNNFCIFVFFSSIYCPTSMCSFKSNSLVGNVVIFVQKCTKWKKKYFDVILTKDATIPWFSPSFFLLFSPTTHYLITWVHCTGKEVNKHSALTSWTLAVEGVLLCRGMQQS